MSTQAEPSPLSTTTAPLAGQEGGPRALWHYTCEDGYQGILESLGMVRPGLDGVAWFTDLDRPYRDGLGLTMASIACDRTAHRFRASDTTNLFPWMACRRYLPRHIVDPLEAARGALPRHWFVSFQAVPVTVDEHRRAAR